MPTSHGPLAYLITTGPSAEVAKTRSTEAYRHLSVQVTPA